MNKLVWQTGEPPKDRRVLVIGIPKDTGPQIHQEPEMVIGHWHHQHEDFVRSVGSGPPQRSAAKVSGHLLGRNRTAAGHQAKTTHQAGYPRVVRVVPQLVYGRGCQQLERATLGTREPS